MHVKKFEKKIHFKNIFKCIYIHTSTHTRAQVHQLKSIPKKKKTKKRKAFFKYTFVSPSVFFSFVFSFFNFSSYHHIFLAVCFLLHNNLEKFKKKKNHFDSF